MLSISPPLPMEDVWRAPADRNSFHIAVVGAIRENFFIPKYKEVDGSVVTYL